MRCILEQERHVDDIDIVDDRAHRSHTDAQHLDGADLGLFDGLLLAAQLHRRKHLDREPPIGGGLEFLAQILGRRHGGIAGGLNVGRLENHFRLRVRGRYGHQGCRRRSRPKPSAQLHEIAASHHSPPLRF